jgi:DNA gyrase subunit A
MTSGKDDIIMVSKSGHAARFNEKLARPMGRGTAGVKGMNVSDKGNQVLSLDVVSARDSKGELLVVTENGYGKRTKLSEYPVKGRGAKGVLTAKLTAKKGGLAGARVVREGQELLFISQAGMVQRTAAGGISQMGRPTQGVRLMNLKKGDRVSAVALVVESAAGDGNGAGPTAAPVEGEVSAAGSTGDATGNGAGDGATVETKPKRAAAKPKRSAAKAKPKATPKAKPAKAKPKPKPAKRAAGSSKRKVKPNPPLASSRKRSKKRK